MSTPKVTVTIPTYNHEEYIRECIASVVAQQVDFELEVLIGEDCSTDSTRAILRELEPTLPPGFRIIYREKNLGLGFGGNVDMLKKEARGKYLITLEGDDFWYEPTKLQKQADFLDAHPEYIAVAHRVVLVDRESRPVPGKRYWDCPDEEYTFRHYRRGLFAGHTGTILYRRELQDAAREAAGLMDGLHYTGDRLKAFLSLLLGRVYCIQQPWSAYRRLQASGHGYTSNLAARQAVRDDLPEYDRRLMQLARSYHDRAGELTAGELYYHLCFESFLRGRGVTFGSWWQAVTAEPDAALYAAYAVYETVRAFLWRKWVTLRIIVRRTRNRLRKKLRR